MRQITGKQIEISDMMKTAMFDILDGFNKYNLSLEKEHVIVKHETHANGMNINIEFILTIRKHETIIINETGEDFYVTLGKIGEKCDKAIRRIHDKDISSKRQKDKHNIEIIEITEPEDLECLVK